MRRGAARHAARHAVMAAQAMSRRAPATRPRRGSPGPATEQPPAAPGARYTYPKIHNPGRIPLYLEHYIDAGEDVKAYADMQGVPWDTSDYTPMVDWKPCLAAEDVPAEYDLWVVNHKLSFLAGTYSAENPLRQEGKGKGVHVNSLLKYTPDRMDALSAAIDSCVKVKIRRLQ